MATDVLEGKALVGLRDLSARILVAQEAERLRVSRELHDETGQALTLLLVRLQLIQNITTEPIVRQELAELRQLVVDALDGVQRLATQLHPRSLDGLGLRAGLQWLASRVREEADLRVDLDVSCGDEPVPEPVSTVVFRVAQEALTNVVRHAHAKRVQMRLEACGGDLVLTVTDDGAGFDVDAAFARRAASVGLLGMTERVALVNGSIDIKSRKAAGTRVVVRVPLREETTT